MRILKYIIVVVLVIVVKPLLSQCITSMDEVLKLIPNDSPAEVILKENFVPRSFNLAFYIATNKQGNHIVDQGQISGIVLNLNQSFENTSISFYSSNIDFIDDYNYSFIDSLQELSELPKIFGTAECINVFVIDSIIYDISVTIKKDTVIYDTNLVNTYVPKIISTNNRDNVFVSAQYLYSSEFVHQLAHLFGLLHTNETKTGSELVDGSNCTSAGDKICDTPADGKGTDPYGRSYIPITGNYMTIYPSGTCHFTPRQIKRMHYFIDNYKTYLK